VSHIVPIRTMGGDGDGGHGTIDIVVAILC